MKFDVVSRIDYMKMSIINNTEYFIRDTFSTVNATYNKTMLYNQMWYNVTN